MDSDFDNAIRRVLRRAWLAPFTARSRFSAKEKDNLEAIMCAVELGLLTLRTEASAWSTVLRITPQGLRCLNPVSEGEPSVELY